MAFKKKFGKKKGNFTRVGNMFKSDGKFLPDNATFAYGTTCDGKYLEAVVETLTKIAEEGGSARFSLTKWKDQDHPVLSVSPAKPKGEGSPRVKTDDQELEDQGDGVL